jgi:hypothetical protein
MTAHIKRPLSIMNSSEVMKKAIGYKLRDPVRGEFGFNHLIGSLFYMQIVSDEKPLSWFFGNKEHSKHVAWDGYYEKDKPIHKCIRHIEKVIVDGKFEIDDLEMTLESASSIFTNGGPVNVFGSTCDTEQILLTSKITKANFITEVAEYCRIQTYSDFNQFLVFITEQRNENHAFKHEKELVSEIYHNLFNRIPPIRSISTMEDVKLEIWGSFMSAGVAIKISEIVTMEAAEIYNYFKTIAQLGTLIDARSLIYCSIEHDTKKIFKSNETIYLGALINRHSNEYSYADTNKINYKIKFNQDYTRFSISLIQLKSNSNARSTYGGQSSTNDLVDIKEIDAAIKGMSTVFKGSESEQFGTFSNIPIAYLNKTKNIRATLIFQSYNKNLFEENWLSKAKSTLQFTSEKKPRTYHFIPSSVKVPPLSVNDLQDLRTSLMDFYQDHYKDKKSFQIPSGSKEEIITKIAEQFARVYTEIKPSIKAAIKAALGCSHAIARPYIVENIKHDYTAMGSIAKSSTLSKTDSSLIMIKSDLLAASLELMEAAKNEKLVLTLSKKFYEREVPANKFSDIDVTIQNKKQSSLIDVYKQVAKLKNPDSNTMLQRFNYKALEKNNLICGIFISICMFEIIENRTFIHFGQNPKSVMVKPKDIVRELLDEGSFSIYTIKESMYINGKTRKKISLNS